MSQSDKAHFYNALKKAGVTFDKHYREYKTPELAEAYQKLVDAGAIEVDNTPPTAAPPPVVDPAAPKPPPPPAAPAIPRAPANPDEMPGSRLNSKSPEQPIRVDENGLVWLQEEVRKPAYPKPRGRRVLKYLETGFKEETIKDGEYVETFEVAGDAPGRPAEVKITLPSYQVGIYRDPRFPFKIYVYNENRGFDLFEVQDFYGGPELVPEEIKRVYIENVLCYDIRTTVRAIQSEFRQMQLAGKVK